MEYLQLVTMRCSNLITYRVAIDQEKGILYRKEANGRIGTWKFHGGSKEGVDYGMVPQEEPQTPGSSVLFRLGGIKANAGKTLEESARKPMREGDSLVVSPIDSPRARELKLSPEKAVCLSGTIYKIETTNHGLEGLL